MRLAAWWIVLCACNQVFDVSETALLPPVDLDHDGVDDITDNCLGVANAGQEDADADGVGDACDTCDGIADSGEDADLDGLDDACDVCPVGPNHDEDGDALFDACDVCPGLAGPQQDSDTNGVGDACEHGDSAARARLFFDGFGPPQPGWLPSFVTWEARDDGYGPREAPFDPRFGAHNPSADVYGTAFQVETAAGAPTPLVRNAPGGGAVIDRFGLALYTLEGQEVMECDLRWVSAFASWVDYQAVAVVVGPVTRFRFVARAGSPGTVSVSCEIDDQTYETRELPLMDAAGMARYIPQLTTTDLTTFQYFDVLR